VNAENLTDQFAEVRQGVPSALTTPGDENPADQQSAAFRIYGPKSY